MTENDTRLTSCFRTVGNRFRFRDVNAEFIAFKDFKVKWQRTPTWIDFRVSDYLSDAPDEVLMALAESIFKRILGEDDRYPPQLYDWITAPGFHRANQDLYLSRCGNLAMTVVGDHKNLEDSYNRLIGAGLVPYDPTIAISWTKDGYNRKMGQCSVLMRVVSISRLLDADDIPDFVLDYCLYHELCHVLVGFDPDSDVHSDSYNGLECKFPEKSEAVYWLKKLSAYA